MKNCYRWQFSKFRIRLHTSGCSTSPFVDEGKRPHTLSGYSNLYAIDAWLGVNHIFRAQRKRRAAITWLNHSSHGPFAEVRFSGQSVNTADDDTNVKRKPGVHDVFWVQWVHVRWAALFICLQITLGCVVADEKNWVFLKFSVCHNSFIRLAFGLTRFMTSLHRSVFC